MRTKSILLLTVMIIMVFSLCSCKGGISGKEAKAATNEFLTAIESGDYEKAAELSHPDTYSTADTIKSFIEAISDARKLDFTDIEIEKYTGISSSYYNSDVKGARYELEMDLLISGVKVEAEIEVVRNSNGYGVYDFELDTE